VGFATRSVAGAVVLAAIIGTLAFPASAWRNPEVKRVKRALIAMEEELDQARSRLRGLARRSDGALRRVDGAHVTLRGEVAHSTGLLDVVRGFGDLSRALYDRDSLEARLREMRRRVRRLENDRTAQIAELERLVRESRVRNAGFSPSWSVDGALVTYSADWQAVAMCESSGRWHIDSEYDGGLQFHPNTWIGFGGGEFARYAYRATKMQQIAVAERVLGIQGEHAWPNCFAHLPFGF
jgi:hypothetical protein